MRVKLKHFRLWAIALLMVLLPKQAAAYTKGDIVRHEGIIYEVIDQVANTLSFVGTESNKTGNIVIPKEWSDGKGINFKVTKVGGNEGYRCIGVTNVTLPEGITEIGISSLTGANLKTLNIPASVKKISHTAFYRVSELPKFTVASGSQDFSDDGHGALYSKDKKELYAVPTDADNVSNGTYTVNTNVEKIYHSAFMSPSTTSGIKKIILPPN